MKNINELLLKHKLTISFAESMTGGRLSSEVTKYSGASKIFNGAIITYSNKTKIELLNVAEATINKYSVVSKEVAIEMVQGLSRVISSDIYVSITGNAGPLLSNDTKNFNCYIAILNNNLLKTHLITFKEGNRDDNINEAVSTVFDLIFELLLEK